MIGNHIGESNLSVLRDIFLYLCVQVHRKYTGEDFDEDLRTVLRRSGCKNEKIAFIMDESNVLDSGFLERMNTLLANGEVELVGIFNSYYFCYALLDNTDYYILKCKFLPEVLSAIYTLHLR